MKESPYTKSLYLLPALLLLIFNSAFAQTDKKKTAYGVLLDNTRSLEKQLPQVLMLGKGLINRLHQRGPISLFSFTTKRSVESAIIPNERTAYEGGNFDLAVAALGVEWSQDKDILGRYLDSLSVVKGQTQLFESIRSMALMLNAKVTAEKDAFGDKVLILITDGEHRMEMISGGPEAEADERRKREKQLIKALKESGIKVYAIGLVQELDASGILEGLTVREKAESFLRRITKETGGRVIFPKSKKIDVDAPLNQLLAP